jgi:hypothetical protein
MKFDKLVTLILEKLRITNPALRITSTGEIINLRPGDEPTHGSLYRDLERRLSKQKNITLDQAYNEVTKMKKNNEIISGFVDNEGNFYDRKEAYKLASPLNIAKYGVPANLKKDDELTSEEIPR